MEQTTGGIGLITIVGNLVRLARGVAPQHQEYLHDATVSTTHPIHIPYSPDRPEWDQFRWTRSHITPMMFVIAQFDGVDFLLTYIYRFRAQFPLFILLHYIYFHF